MPIPQFSADSSRGGRQLSPLFLCRKKKRQKKNDDADASPLKLVLECRDFNVALLFESLGNIPEKREESVLIAVPHA